jgi:hypothetical protein
VLGELLLPCPVAPHPGSGELPFPIEIVHAACSR